MNNYLKSITNSKRKFHNKCQELEQQIAELENRKPASTKMRQSYFGMDAIKITQVSDEANLTIKHDKQIDEIQKIMVDLEEFFPNYWQRKTGVQRKCAK